MKNKILISVSALILLFITACTNQENKSSVENSAIENSSIKMEEKKMSIKEENVSYVFDNIKMNGFVAYDESTDIKRPVVLIVHEWWGLNEYPKARAKQLAELGYLAFAIDLYGEGKTADNPDMAGKLAGLFYTDPMLAKNRFDAALSKIKTFSIADTTKIAAIGYCFGGSVVLNVARLGENLKGVVSFHGNLLGAPLDKKLLKADILVCHGEADKFVKAEEVAKFKKQMDDAGVPYTFKSYPGATHAFSNPKSTENGKKFSMPIEYNAAADTASFNEMKSFFKKIF